MSRDTLAESEASYMELQGPTDRYVSLLVVTFRILAPANSILASQVSSVP